MAISATSFATNYQSSTERPSESNSPIRTPNSQRSLCARSSSPNVGTNLGRAPRLNWWLLPEMSNRVTIFRIKWFYRLVSRSSVLAVLTGTLLAQPTDKPKRNLLFIGQAKGYQHEA